METHRVQMFCQFENQIVNEKLKLQTKSSKKKKEYNSLKCPKSSESLSNHLTNDLLSMQIMWRS